MNPVFILLFFSSSEYPNTLRIFGLFHYAFITKDDPLKVFLCPILVLYDSS